MKIVLADIVILTVMGILAYRFDKKRKRDERKYQDFDQEF